MNWIQKLLSFVQRQDEEYIEEDAPKIKSGESRKDLQTRVSYQYPKGEFRFPLIPDESAAKKERGEKKEKAKEPEKSRIIEKSPHAGPFKPTDVPSPVYGFRERPKAKPVHNSEPVEYEISSFTELKRKIAREKEEKESEKKPAEVDQLQKASYQQVPEENESDTASLGIEPELPLQEEETSPEVPAHEVEEPSQEEDLVEPINQTPEPDHLEPVDTDSTQVTDNEITEPESPIEEPAAQVQESNNQEASEHVQKSDDTKPRNRVPFNVMMLKQDKRKRAEEPYNKAETEVKEEKPVHTETAAEPVEAFPHFMKPSLDLLAPPVFAEPDQDWLDYQAELLNETLFHFNVNATVKNVTQGPSVTRFELFPDKGVKVSKITSLTDDIKLGLAARDIRMEAPIPGKMAVGIEIPNPHSRPVAIKEILAHEDFQNSEAELPVALGLDIEGKPVITDISKMPHGLIAGATGSGKSVCINSILISLMYHASPDDVKMLLIDPKVVELAPYNHIPHLVSPVITDVKAATAALKWAVEEMERRYQLFAHAGVRDIKRYNHKVKNEGNYSQKLPYLVVVIDELADLMMMAPADVEEAICRIAQKARACGIHLLIATQRPSVDVITGLIKANVPTRIAFSVSSQVDSRTIIDSSGAERLLGRGDMLFLENGASKPVRLQGTFVSDDEIDDVAAHVKNERKASYLFEQEELLAKVEFQDEEDELLTEACEFVIAQGGASTSLLQRQFRIGYNRAARLIDMMEKNGWISESKGSKPRDVLMAQEDLMELTETAKPGK
ncbi:DNA translocase FtsK [Jeotgalibacillus terrae]|uniref:DNA translocase FtsK n=1 Tax=Jeotgalibacillus terrae TaxID=587735 RepID=A0ABW5ZJW3_9BACL|nr:DNA translocase FtsK [Jeotgalibacillus terrae]MBM7578981.1 S-DNA-T family DNA segregation ATPase FtsK/SpoIIIE [Jeotgalibacillus terrae]